MEKAVKPLVELVRWFTQRDLSNYTFKSWICLIPSRSSYSTLMQNLPTLSDLLLLLDNTFSLIKVVITEL